MVDMHIHTNYSDGKYSVDEIINMLRELKVDLFSITDHDNIHSVYDMANISLFSDVKYVPGVEFSSRLGNYNCHILGYDFNKNEIISNECNIIRNRKIEKILVVVKHLKELGIEITDSEISSILNKTGTFSRMDLCKILISRGYGNKGFIYDNYLNVPNLTTHRSNAKHIVDVIKKANGKSILAHPKEIEIDYNLDISDIIKYFLEIGIDGIEVYNSVHSLSDVKRYLELAVKYNLFTTGGSDFHGDIYPDRVLGTSTLKHLKVYKSNLNLWF